MVLERRFDTYFFCSSFYLSSFTELAVWNILSMVRKEHLHKTNSGAGNRKKKGRIQECLYIGRLDVRLYAHPMQFRDGFFFPGYPTAYTPLIQVYVMTLTVSRVIGRAPRLPTPMPQLQ